VKAAASLLLVADALHLLLSSVPPHKAISGYEGESFSAEVAKIFSWCMFSHPGAKNVSAFGPLF
jgi:hypothetical protein